MMLGQEVRGVPKPRCVDTIQRLGDLFGDLEQLAIRVETNGSSLGKARARALQWAHESKADVWVTVDDDVCASPGTLQTLVRLCREAGEPRVIVAPYAIRVGENATQAGVSVHPIPGAQPVEHGLLLPIKRAGFGLVAMNRAALEAIVTDRPTCKDDDGSRIPLVFNCHVKFLGRLGDVPPESNMESEWLGEDFSFFEQTRASVFHYALLRGETDHAGALVDLADVAKLFAPDGVCG